MALTYKNLEITPGISTLLSFDILDDNFLKVDLTGSVCKLEIFDSHEKIIFSSPSPNLVSLGLINFHISDIQSRVLKHGLYNYRLVTVNSGSISRIYYKGFVSVSTPEFNVNDNAENNIITLPDGSIYANSAITLVPDSWYALSSVFRFLVSGVGTFTMDGRDLHGIVWRNMGVYNSTSLDDTRWIPELSGMTAFRVKLVAGNATVRYLP